MRYRISEIFASDTKANMAVNALLEEEGIRRDRNLDYVCGIYDDDMNLVATGSCFRNTLRCFAVRSSFRGEGLLNSVLSHLVDVEYRRGCTHLFLYTKCSTAKFFRDTGFYEIVRVEDKLVFMENRRTGFAAYLDSLERPSVLSKRNAAIVMNANPFTLGHQYLVEKAASENDAVHLFVVSENESLFPPAVRKRLVIEGTSCLKNVIVHDSGPYIVSNATFPSYFQKDEADVIEGHARLDTAVFTKIAAALGITARYIGEEPFSMVTGIYNTVMERELPAAGIRCVVVPRKTAGGRAISASDVRRALKSNDETLLRSLVPPSTFRYLASSEAVPVIECIRRADDVVHY